MNNFHGLTGISTKFKALISLLSASTMINLTPLNHADQVTDWNATLVVAMRTASDLPPVSARKAAIVQAAVYDAVNGITREFEPYFVNEWAPGGARPEAAAAQAAYTTLLEMYPGQKDLFDQQLATAFASIPGNEGHSESIERGVAWGNYVADQILEWRTQDGFSTPYPPFYGGTYIGEWRSIPNGTLPAILPSFRFMTPFTLLRADQFRPGPPPALTSAQYAADVNETEALGRKTGSTRTPEQTDLARLWAASALPEENVIASSVLPPDATLTENARLFALLNMAACDAFIIGFDCKYTYNFWRPFHAIRLADLDNNPATIADPAWEPLVPTPNHQEYISFHSVVTGAFMQVLSHFFGDERTFTLSTPALPGISKEYHSFSEAVAEVKEARIWGGMHFRNSCETGQQIGYAYADYLLANFLLPHGNNGRQAGK